MRSETSDVYHWMPGAVLPMHDLRGEGQLLLVTKNRPCFHALSWKVTSSDHVVDLIQGPRLDFLFEVLAFLALQPATQLFEQFS